MPVTHNNSTIVRGVAGTEYTMSFTVNAGEDRFIVLRQSYLGDLTGATGVTFKSLPMTEINDGESREKTYVLANPPVGTYDMVFTGLNASSSPVIWVCCLNGIFQDPSLLHASVGRTITISGGLCVQTKNVGNEGGVRVYCVHSDNNPRILSAVAPFTELAFLVGSGGGQASFGLYADLDFVCGTTSFVCATNLGNGFRTSQFLLKAKSLATTM